MQVLWATGDDDDGPAAEEQHADENGGAGAAARAMPISRGSLLSRDVAAAHRLEIGICAVGRDDGEEILRVSQQGVYGPPSKLVCGFCSGSCRMQLCILCCWGMDQAGIQMPGAWQLLRKQRCMQIVAASAVARGCEVHNTYGELGSADLVHKYGFAPRPGTNPFAAVTLDKAALVAEAARLLGARAARLRCRFLAQERCGT